MIISQVKRKINYNPVLPDNNDKIYTIGLHGNAKKKESAPDGSADINVLDTVQTNLNSE